MSALVDTPAVLTVEEAAELLRVGRSAAYAAVKSGDIPSIKVGRSIRVPKFQLERMLGLQDDNGPVGAGPESRHATEGTPHEQLHQE